MITRLGMAPRAAHLTYEAFQEHWRSEHASVASRIPGLRAYVQNHAVLVEGRPVFPYAGIDACSELEFDDLDAMDAGFASAHYRQAVVADENALIDKSRFAMVLGRRRILIDRDPGPDAVKLLSFMPVDPRSNLDALDARLSGQYREIVAQAEPLRHEQLIVIPGAHDGRIPALCAAVDALWFSDVNDVLDFVNGEIGHSAGYALAGTAFGTERLLARTIRVV